MLKQGQSNLRLEVMRECPEHPHKNGCQLCEKRQDDKECTCKMCSGYISRQEENEVTNRAARVSYKVEQKMKKHKMQIWPLKYILKRLLPPHNKTLTQSLGVFIPEICFYKEGEAEVLYMNSQIAEKSHDVHGIREPPVIRIKKQKLTNTQIQKIMNEKRRKYREKVGTLRKFQRTPSDKMGNKELPTETKDAVVICCSTKDQNYQQLHEQNYFIGLMLRRKQDPIFKPIEFIKNFIGISDEDKNVFFCKHQEGKTKYPDLWKRSRQLMKVYGSNIIPKEEKYISVEEQSQFLFGLSQQKTDCYAYYTLYKIINYIEFFYDEKVSLISAKFLVNEVNEIYLLHVYNVIKTDLVKYAWTEEIYQKKIAEGEEKLIKRIPRVELDGRSRNRSAMIQDQMKNQYENLKFVMGLSHVEKNDQEERNNNAFFSMLHPEVPGPISELLKDKTMTVHKFKHKYMGYRNKKRPVAPEFNSNLVKTLHKLTPTLRVARGHEVQDVQWQRGICSAGGKRSMSQGNTISTMNRTGTLFL